MKFVGGPCGHQSGMAKSLGDIMGELHGPPVHFLFNFLHYWIKHLPKLCFP